MQNKRHVLHRAAFICLILALFQACSARQIVVVGPPYDRYDHNRTRAIVVSSPVDAHPEDAKLMADEVYTPFGSVFFPTAEYRGEKTHADGLPSANIVPIFTGIGLPLSDTDNGDGRSDHGDMVDFLASGTDAHAGVERGSMAGDRKSTLALYKPVLDLLGSEANLRGTRDDLIGKHAPVGVPFADEVIDSRYGPGSFDDVVAFRFEKFWFILYKLPDRKEYSRLVIVPAGVKAQDFPGKRL